MKEIPHPSSFGDRMLNSRQLEALYFLGNLYSIHVNQGRTHSFGNRDISSSININSRHFLRMVAEECLSGRAIMDDLGQDYRLVFYGRFVKESDTFPRGEITANCKNQELSLWLKFALFKYDFWFNMRSDSCVVNGFLFLQQR